MKIDAIHCYPLNSRVYAFIAVLASFTRCLLKTHPWLKVSSKSPFQLQYIDQSNCKQRWNTATHTPRHCRSISQLNRSSGILRENGPNWNSDCLSLFICQSFSHRANSSRLVAFRAATCRRSVARVWQRATSTDPPVKQRASSSFLSLPHGSSQGSVAISLLSTQHQIQSLRPFSPRPRTATRYRVQLSFSW